MRVIQKGALSNPQSLKKLEKCKTKERKAKILELPRSVQGLSTAERTKINRHRTKRTTLTSSDNEIFPRKQIIPNPSCIKGKNPPYNKKGDNIAK